VRRGYVDEFMMSFFLLLLATCGILFGGLSKDEVVLDLLDGFIQIY
jgi:hypothetical protein